ncbi:unnamed protein product [Caenorhabditis bovis]|uniref:Tyrosine aminotransferase n=1 Tax=Caenorhabditis bovis TaxID=2654633 RepID=A0A8S1EGA8_9PELO|nr:unnamed protein product [Caenorhabditis bovis]
MRFAKSPEYDVPALKPVHQSHTQVAMYTTKALNDHMYGKEHVEAPPNMMWPKLRQSKHSLNTVNPVRKIADACAIPHNPEKKPIRLHLGDPTLGGELPASPVAIQALHEAIDSHASNGYGPAVGSLAARQAIVDKYSTSAAPFTVNDVVLASGCSHALQMAIEAIADPGDNILVPHPGFPLYSTLCRPHGIIDKAYRIDMENNDVVIDLGFLKSLVDDRTKAIIINNPGNPTGGVFSKHHLRQILQFALEYGLVIIADEIYGDLVYNGAKFHPIATLSPKVPVITCDGIAKRWMVPGWRLGWLVIHDRYNALADVRKGIVALSQKIVGPCSLVQGALPKILRETPESYFQHNRKFIEKNANIVERILGKVNGIKVIKPCGAMYMMIAIEKKHYGGDVEFCQGLIAEQSVFCLPGEAFSAGGYFRVVLTCSHDEMTEAAKRIKHFCIDHYIERDDSEESSDEGLDLSQVELD